MNVNSFLDLKPNPNIPDFRPGDTVRVHSKIIEGERERIQAFEGVVIRIRRAGPSSAFTVRRVSHGVGIERVFPYFSPLIEKVQVMRVGRVRRAKLYYLRERVGKAARIRTGSRARFEALTAARPVAAPDIEEEIEETPPEAEELAEEVVEDTAAEETAEPAAEEAPEPEPEAEPAPAPEEPEEEQAPA